MPQILRLPGHTYYSCSSVAIRICFSGTFMVCPWMDNPRDMSCSPCYDSVRYKMFLVSCFTARIERVLLLGHYGRVSYDESRRVLESQIAFLYRCRGVQQGAIIRYVCNYSN